MEQVIPSRNYGKGLERWIYVHQRLRETNDRELIACEVGLPKWATLSTWISRNRDKFAHINLNEFEIPTIQEIIQLAEKKFMKDPMNKRLNQYIKRVVKPGKDHWIVDVTMNLINELHMLKKS